MILDFKAAKDAKDAARHDHFPVDYPAALKQFRTLLRVHGYPVDDTLADAIQPALGVILDRIKSLAPSKARADADMLRIIEVQNRKWLRDIERRETG